MPPVARPPAVEAAAVVDGITAELERLHALEREYRITVAALAVVVEQLLVLTHGTSVCISDEALAACPDLGAWRDAPARAVVITAHR